jgi:hypothetical protein
METHNSLDHNQSVYYIQGKQGSGIVKSAEQQSWGGVTLWLSGMGEPAIATFLHVLVLLLSEGHGVNILVYIHYAKQLCCILFPLLSAAVGCANPILQII